MSASPRAAQILLVGQKIRQIRKSRRLTQADLAARIGVTQSDLSRMENGEYKVGLDTLFKILQVFELSMSRFFDEPAPEISSPDDGMEFDDFAVPEQEEILRDLATLSEDSLKEVRDFIAFKKLQATAPSAPWRSAPPPPMERPSPLQSPLTGMTNGTTGSGGTMSVSRSLREVPRNDVG